MKNKFLENLLLLFLISFLCLPSRAGNEGANAGDDVGLEFQASYLAALNDIKNQFEDLHALIAATAAWEIAERVQVIVVSEPLEVLIGDQWQDSVATNDLSKNLILVNRARWNAIESTNIKKGLALHEILSLAGLESSALYPISSQYLSRMMANEHKQQNSRR